MTEFRGLVIAVLLAGLFTFAIISFGVNLSLSHGSGTILENEIINRTFTDLQTNLGEIQATTEEQKKAWYQDLPIAGDLSIILITTTAVVKGIIEVVRGIFNLFAELVAVTLGIGEDSAKVVVGTFTGIMIFSLILLAWSVLRSGK